MNNQIPPVTSLQYADLRIGKNDLTTVSANGGVLFASFDKATHTNYRMKKINSCPRKLVTVGEVSTFSPQSEHDKAIPCGPIN